MLEIFYWCKSSPFLLANILKSWRQKVIPISWILYVGIWDSINPLVTYCSWILRIAKANNPVSCANRVVWYVDLPVNACLPYHQIERDTVPEYRRDRSLALSMKYLWAVHYSRPRIEDEPTELIFYLSHHLRSGFSCLILSQLSSNRT